jgi:hypothetical protein
MAFFLHLPQQINLSMRYLIPIVVSAFLTLACNTQKEAQNTTNKPIKSNETDTLYFTMERTPCFGMCPTDKVQIFSDGKVIYEGIRFVDRMGLYEGEISEGQLIRLENQLRDMRFFMLQDEYDGPVTDLPSTIFSVLWGEKEKRIVNRFNGDPSLKTLEALIVQLLDEVGSWRSVEPQD